MYLYAFGGTTDGASTYFNDEADKDQRWYWDVRNHIEKMCSDVIIVEKNEE
jgi:hypothetical protein